MICRRNQRGIAFVTTLWVIIVLTSLTLTLGFSVRVEATAAANRLAAAQADAAERGVEQFLLAAVESEVTSPGSTATISMEDIPVGDAHGWVLKPSPDDSQNQEFGLTDEAGKLDLNTAALARLELLPGMTDDIAASIVNWRGATPAANGLGASDSYYQSLPNPYSCKHAKFETVEELMLLKDMDATLLYANDRNRNGLIDGAEQQGSGGIALFNGANGSDLGIFPLVTIYGVIASTARPAAASATGTTTATVNVNQNPAALTSPNSQFRRKLASVLSAATVERIINQMPQPPAPAPNYASTFEWAADMRLTGAEYSKVIHLLTATPAEGAPGGAAITAKINVNSAPEAVLMCLPSLTQADAEAISAHRQQDPTPADPSDISWLLDVVTDRTKQRAIANEVAGTSSCFSGDIVAVSADGRAFKRVRIVIDARQSPCKIIYRRDLTSYGWPLSADVRTALRSSNSGAGGAGGGAGASSLLPGKGGTTQ